MLYLYRVSVILLLCLSASGCCVWRCIFSPSQDPWYITQIPPFGGKNAAVGCSNHINTPDQENEARTIALHKLAQQLGGVLIDASTGMEFQENDGVLITDQMNVSIKMGTSKQISADLKDTRLDPSGNGFCLWMLAYD